MLLGAGATATLIHPGRMYAQAVSGSLLGTVQDKTGAAVPNVRVIITEKATNISHEAQTNTSGNYSFQNLSPGTYSVTVELTGFQRETRPAVDVLINNTTRTDFDLNPGNVSETIEVTDRLPMLQTDRADVSTKIEQQSVESLPMGVNRNFQSLLNLVPGTTPASFQHSQFFNAGSTLQTQVNGLPRMGNAYNIEGIDDGMRTGLLQILIPPADAIASVEVSTNNFQVELGRAIGAVTNVTLKSGANKFHGSASEYLQNSYFNARSYFAAAAGKVVYNYYGGNISGPIIKDKLFFYGDYFRTADHERTSNTLTIPFPKYYTPNSAGFIDLSDLPTQVYDPNTGDRVTGAGRTPFAGNLIPIGRVNATSLKLLQALPRPNQNLNTLGAPSNNFFVNSPFFKDANTYDGKIDYQVTPKDHLSLRYSQQIYSLYQAPSFSSFLGGPGNGGGFAGTGHQNAFSTGLNFDHAFSSTLLTEIRVGVAHYRNTSQPADYGVSDATTAGAPGVNVDQLTSGQLGINIGTFSSGPFIGYSPSMPWIRAEANIDFVNNWTKIIGNHTVRFGVDIRRVRDELLQGQTYSPRGVTTFGQNQTSTPGAKTGAANDIASMLLDVPSGVGRDLFTYFPAFRQWWYFGFVGDKWQVTPKLTLDLGVRWEFYQPATPAKAGGFSAYDPGPNQLRVAGIGANPSDLGYKAQMNYWAPRTGFAYRVTDQTVVRGGIGMAYMPYADNTWLYNYPVRANNAYTSCGSGSSFLSAQYTCSGNVNSQPVTFQSGFPAPVPVVVPPSGVYQIDASNSLLNNQTYIYIPQDYHNPYVYSYNLSVQQALPGNFSLSLAYVGNHGVRIGAANNINLPDRLNCGTACQPLQIKFNHSAAVTQQFIGFSSNYSSLQAILSRRFSNGLSSNSSYTWGKGMGYQQGDDGAITFFQDLRRNYARNDFDRTSSFSQSITYELPVGKGKKFLNTGFLAQAVGGWKVSGIVLLYTGIPFQVTANGGTINTAGWTQTANLVAPYKTTKGIGNNAQWFDPASFGQPVGCTGQAATPTTAPCPIVNGVSVGNTGRNAFTGPGLFQNNASIFKTFGLPKEGTTLDVRMDVFQLTNTPQFANPSNSITSPTFGKVTSTTGSGSGVNGTGGGRSLQLAAIFKF
ncbi:hypothetical protein Terro_4207 [Terriglobus roseus DSM 18391]|uniref:TonB-dependent transporter Oar-like beta-barrel domain-containing protein n=1 Tax=Terriglobus roseus (strain DSM 18391 / NRRL B-41598 / KBS 63) TaxID=926566 RepID=I3ZME4_TERRK|nr:carboxypeptidase regulatory-like domain-containing protein [Terriglobus roseus]AFL90412.1 hypothetical protein Terro_4207 [Terriglobus roseus DSM 18391]